MLGDDRAGRVADWPAVAPRVGQLQDRKGDIAVLLEREGLHIRHQGGKGALVLIGEHHLQLVCLPVCRHRIGFPPDEAGPPAVEALIAATYQGRRRPVALTVTPLHGEDSERVRCLDPIDLHPPVEDGEVIREWHVQAELLDPLGQLLLCLERKPFMSAHCSIPLISMLLPFECWMACTISTAARAVCASAMKGLSASRAR